MIRLIRYQTWLVAGLMLIVGSMAGGAFVGASMVQAGHAPESAFAVAAPPVREAVSMPATFAPVVKAVLPAVVNISSTKVIRTSEFPQDNPFGDRRDSEIGFRQQVSNSADLHFRQAPAPSSHRSHLPHSVPLRVVHLGYLFLFIFPLSILVAIRADGIFQWLIGGS